MLVKQIETVEGDEREREKDSTYTYPTAYKYNSWPQFPIYVSLVGKKLDCNNLYNEDYIFCVWR